MSAKYIAIPPGEHVVVFDMVHAVRDRGLVIVEARFVTPLREDQLMPAAPSLVKLLETVRRHGRP